MEIIPLMLISVIILLTSFPAPIKVSGRGGGGGFVGSGNSPSIGSGYFGGGGNPGTGYMGGGIPSGGSIRDGSNVGTGYRGGFQGGKPSGGGDPGAAIVVFPKKPEEPVKVVPTPMPQVCEPKVRHCINVHVYGRAGQPHRGGACCNKFSLRAHGERLGYAPDGYSLMLFYRGTILHQSFHRHCDSNPYDHITYHGVYKY